MNAQMNKANKVHDWCSSPPLPSTFQARYHSPDLSLEHVHDKPKFHRRVKNGKHLSTATLTMEIQSVKTYSLLILILQKPIQ